MTLCDFLKANAESLSAEEKWCIFFKYRHENYAEPLIRELCRKEEGIMHAEQSLYKLSWSEKRYFRNMDRIKGEMEREDAKRYAMKIGHAEGKAEGEAEERQKIIQLIDQGLSTEEIKQRLLAN